VSQFTLNSCPAATNKKRDRTSRFGAAPRRLVKIRIVVADTNLLSCRLLSESLESQPHFEVVASVVDHDSLIESLRGLKPDIALVSAHLEGGALTGLTRLREIPKQFPSLHVIVLLDRSDPDQIVQAFRAGARGVFCRSESEPKILYKCINRVFEGQIWADSTQLGYVMEALVGQSATLAPVEASDSLLTAREKGVMRLVAEGMGNREIAQQLKLSEHTVKNYLFRIFSEARIQQPRGTGALRNR
jgi:DNA-binding NarL/FixJ family response regulator